MTSLIDVIFLLLLFFMLSSTFSQFSEVELAASGTGSGQAQADTRPVFLRLAPDDLSLNGQKQTLETLADALRTQQGDAPEQPVIVALNGEVTAQRLTDLLVTLRTLTGLRVTILEST